ncbi:MAG: LamG domain-containing protein [Myxococcales bacterium]|nr:LamG domain-containing protein [Myxococcales bacterium]
MFSRGTPLVVFVFAVVGAGCSLFVLDEGEFSGGGRAPATERDADVAPSEAGASDPDGASPDTGVDAATSRYASAILADEPTLYSRLGESKGTTAKATAGADGTYSVAGLALGAPGAIAGDPDTAVTLTDGSGRITIDTGASFDGLVPFSVELWVKPSPSNTTLGLVFDHTYWSGSERRGWNFLAGNEQTNFERWVSATDRSIAYGAPVSVGQWHHLVGTFDGATLRVYVDGLRVSESTTSVVLPARTSVLTIGHQSCDCGRSNSFIGDIDELAVYDRALTDTQIAAHYAAAK